MILQVNKYMCMYMYIFILRFQHNVCRKVRVCLRHELRYAARKECGTSDVIAHQLAINKLMDIDLY